MVFLYRAGKLIGSLEVKCLVGLSEMVWMFSRSGRLWTLREGSVGLLRDGLDVLKGWEAYRSSEMV